MKVATTYLRKLGELVSLLCQNRKFSNTLNPAQIHNWITGNASEYGNYFQNHPHISTVKCFRRKTVVDSERTLQPLRILYTSIKLYFETPKSSR